MEEKGREPLAIVVPRSALAVPLRLRGSRGKDWGRSFQR
jgi:hypothetical protein